MYRLCSFPPLHINCTLSNIRFIFKMRPQFTMLLLGLSALPAIATAVPKASDDPPPTTYLGSVDVCTALDCSEAFPNAACMTYSMGEATQPEAYNCYDLTRFGLQFKTFKSVELTPEFVQNGCRVNFYSGGDLEEGLCCDECKNSVGTLTGADHGQCHDPGLAGDQFITGLRVECEGV